MKYPELLAPAGNLEKLKIAIQYGADAVYIAGQQFGLRSAADNFSLSDLQEGIGFAHEHGRKVYLALNAFLHDHELEALPEFLDVLVDYQPDALICSDLGVIKTVKDNSEIPIHLSTQASVINTSNAKIWKSFGIQRIVVGRELSIKEASTIARNAGIEVEMFVHGAMCVSYSGHCTISNYTAGRDANRGGCIQNCRFKYQLIPEDSEPVESYFMSSKDLSGMEQLGKFTQSGIDSLKIEGRMKSNLYIASTVRAYSQALKELVIEGNPDLEYWSRELQKIPHRDYTTGSLLNDAGVDSIYDKQDEELCDYEMSGTILFVDKSKKRFAYQIKNKLKKGNKIEVLPFKGSTIEVEILELINISDLSLDVGQPNCVIWLPWVEGIEVHNVARIQKAQTK
ncbi:MAG: U32 family peptidase [Proteobacteria bacterium]|nr:U32 family peptidase [Pseudomonadota bacterium]